VDQLRVVVQSGTGYELLLSALTVANVSSRNRVELGARFQGRARAIDPAVGQALRRIGREPLISLMGWVHAMTEVPTAAQTLDSFVVADPAELKLAALGYHRRAMRAVTPAPIIRAAAAGERSAIAAMRRTSYPELGHWQATLRHVLAVPAGELRDELVTALRAWYALVFSEVEPAIADEQDADADATRGLLASRDLDAVLEIVAPGLTFARELGQSTVVLVPSVVVRPSFAMTDYGPTLVIAYPAGRHAAPDAPPPNLVHVGKALGDELRLRVLRGLRAGPLSTSELARQLGVPRTSLQHHVAILLQAGLVAMAVDDAQTGALELRPKAIGAIGREAERWILGDETPEPSAG
jgi:DNA-binding transcriptional ArsR family regulator